MSLFWEGEVCERLRTHCGSRPNSARGIRARQGVFGKEERKLVPMSVAWETTEMIRSRGVLVELGENLGKNKAFLPSYSI